MSWLKPNGRDLANGETLDNVASGMFRRPRTKAALLDFQCANLRFERRTRDSEPCSRSRGTEDAPFASTQGIFNDCLFVNGQRAGQAELAFELGSRGQPTLVDDEFVGVRDNHRPLDNVLQLANVPRPHVGLQVIESPLADAPESLPCLPRVAADEVLHQHGDIFPPVPQRWHLDGKYVKPIKEVLTERSVCHCYRQVTIGRRDDADIDLYSFSSSYPLEFPFLEHPQQRDLRFG